MPPFDVLEMPGERERSRSDDVPGRMDGGQLPPGHLCPIAACDEAKDTIVVVATIKNERFRFIVPPNVSASCKGYWRRLSSCAFTADAYEWSGI